MPIAHLTDVVVSRLSIAGTYYDQTTPAFGIRVGKRRKTWFVIRGRERLRTNIGQYPQVGLADARKAARKLLTEPVTRGTGMKFDAAYDLYKEAIATKKPRTQRDYKRMVVSEAALTIRCLDDDTQNRQSRRRAFDRSHPPRRSQIAPRQSKRRSLKNLQHHFGIFD